MQTAMQTTLQNTLNRMTSPVRRFAAGTWLGLFAVLTLCLCAVPASAGGNPPTRIVATGTPVQIGVMNFNSSSGGWDGGESPLGGTFVIGANGNVIIGDGYSSAVDVFEITPAGTQTVIGVGGTNSHAAAIDVYGNVYVGFGYDGTIVKLPYNSVTGAYAGYTAVPSTNCGTTNGAINDTDTAACIFAPNVQAKYNGISGMAFDGQGNLVIATSDNGYSGAANQVNNNLVLVCNAQCEADASGTYLPQVVYADTTNIGAIAADPWGDIFYVDGSNSKGGVTNLNEIAFKSAGSYGSPAVVESYTSEQSSNGIAGLAVGADGTVYFGTNYDGIFGIPNSNGVLNLSGAFIVSNAAGAKAIAVDPHGNFAFINYNGGDVISYLPTGSFQAGSSPLNPTAPLTASVTVVDSAAACTPTLTFAATHFGVTSTDYTASAGSCSTAYSGSNGTFSPAILASGGAAIVTGINFTPAAAGTRNATLTITDSANNAAGTVALSGTGLGAIANVDPGNALASLTTGLTSPVAAVADPMGDLFVADASGHVYELSSGKTSTVGSGFTTPSALAFDANGDLFIADNGVPAIFEMPNVGTTGAFAAGTQVTLIGATTPIGGETLKNPVGLAVGPDGTLYIADSAEARVVAYNPATGVGGLTGAVAGSGLVTPQGLAVDGSGNLYVADPGAAEVFIFTAAGVESTLSSVPGVTSPVGVAVDASGSVLIADGDSGNIVRVPYLSATPGLTLAQAVTIETLTSPQTASSLAMDSSGNYITVASSSGKAAYVIQRNAASINLGLVADLSYNSGTIYLMNAGNETATLANPDLLQPTNTIFTLNPGATNGCTAGATGPAGVACTITAEFAPVGTDTGPYSDSTGAILIGTPSLSIPVTISGTASVSSLQSQTITYSPAPPATAYVGQQIMLSATATSGLAVVFTSATSSICSVTGTTATMIATGTCTIDANQGGGNNSGQSWGIAPQVVTNITVTSATPTGVPGMVMTQVGWIYASGAFTDGENPSGGSFAVTPNGEIVVGTTYNGNIDVINAQTGVLITQVSGSSSGITTDSYGSLYISNLYNQAIYKVPYNSTTGAYPTGWSDPSTAPPNCEGYSSSGTDLDTAECTYVTFPAPSKTFLNGQNNGAHDIAFDSSGNFYLATEPNEQTGGSGGSYLYACGAGCLPTATIAPGTASLLYTDPNGISEIAADPWGNLFFTDADYLTGGTGGDNEATNAGASSSNLYEITAAQLTAFFANPSTPVTPTLLQSFTNTPAPAAGAEYTDMIAGVAVNSTTGTIYYSTLYDGTFAIPNTQSSGPAVSDEYAVSSQGAKSINFAQPSGFTTGNLYLVSNQNSPTSADTTGVLFIGDLSAGNGPVLGTPVTASANVVDNAIGCGTTATLAFTSTNSQFSATAGGTCSSIGMGDATLLTAYNGASSYGATITFAPINQGTQSATLSVSDTTNGGTGTAAVSGTGVAVSQTITFTAPTTTTFTYSPGLSIQLEATTTGASNSTTNLMQFAVATCETPVSPATECGAGTISTPVLSNGVWSATLTVTQAGSITINASQAGGLVNNVYYETTTQPLALTVSQAPDTITFTPPTSPVTYTPGLTITLTATGSGSTSPIVFSIDTGSSTGAGTISGNTLTVTQAGTIVIDANQAADPNYSQAPEVSVVLVVSQATQTISVTVPTTPLYYIASCSPISLCATVTITATGGATGNPVLFSADPTNAVPFTTLSTSVTNGITTSTLALSGGQNLTFPANLVIDATQAGNANYAAATVVTTTISVGAPLPVQTITWPNPGTQVEGTPLTLNATASSGFAVVYTSTTTSVCTVSDATATFVAAGTCTIIATQPGDNQTYAPAVPVTQSFLVEATGAIPAMSVNLSLSSMTITAGTVGTANITLTSVNNFTGSVVFSCSGLPSGYYCTFNPVGSSSNPLMLNPASTAVTTLSVSSSSSASLERGPRPFVPLATLAAALCLIGFKKRNRFFLILLIALSVTGLSLFSGCGGSTAATTKTTTSTATLTATSGTTTTSTTFTVIIN